MSQNEVPGHRGYYYGLAERSGTGADSTLTVEVIRRRDRAVIGRVSAWGWASSDRHGAGIHARAAALIAREPARRGDPRAADWRER